MTKKVKSKIIEIKARSQWSRGRGREATGLYPQFSRRKLADTLGVHRQVVCRILTGKRRLPVELAIPMAAAMGVSVERLSRDVLKVQQKDQRAKERLRLAEAGTWDRWDARNQNSSDDE